MVVDLRSLREDSDQRRCNYHDSTQPDEEGVSDVVVLIDGEARDLTVRVPLKDAAKHPTHHQDCDEREDGGYDCCRDKDTVSACSTSAGHERLGCSFDSFQTELAVVIDRLMMDSRQFGESALYGVSLRDSTRLYSFHP